MSGTPCCLITTEAARYLGFENPSARCAKPTRNAGSSLSASAEVAEHTSGRSLILIASCEVNPASVESERSGAPLGRGSFKNSWRSNKSVIPGGRQRKESGHVL